MLIVLLLWLNSHIFTFRLLPLQFWHFCIALCFEIGKIVVEIENGLICACTSTCMPRSTHFIDAKQMDILSNRKFLCLEQKLKMPRVDALVLGGATSTKNCTFPATINTRILITVSYIFLNDNFAISLTS